MILAMPDNAQEEVEPAERPKRQGPPPTPFDHPMFLPVLLAGFTLWFGYDGFINADPEMLEHETFNRYGFFVLLVLTAFAGRRGYRHLQEDQQKAKNESKD